MKVKKSDLNKLQQLLIDLELKLTDEIFQYYSSSIDVEKIQDVDSILQEIGKIIIKYPIKDEKLNLAFKDRTTLNKEFNSIIQDKYLTEYQVEKKLLTAALKGIAFDQFNSKGYLMKPNWKIQDISDKNLKTILDYKVEGKTYSDRIWQNKDDIAKRMKLEIQKLFKGDTGLNDIYKNIEKINKTNRRNTERLVNTEIARVQYEADEHWRENNSIVKYVMYCATLDRKTCSDCIPLDGEFYKVGELKPILPRHPSCRCTYLDLVDKDWKPSYRLDNETKSKINYKTYLEWKEEANK